MKTFKEILTESNYKDAPTFATELEKKIKAIMPKSYVSVHYSTNIAKSISITFTFGKDNSEYNNNIRENDRGHTKIYIGMGRGGNVVDELPEKMQAESTIGNGIKVTDPTGRYAFVTEKLVFRKKTGNAAQIEKAILDYFKKFKELYIKLDKEGKIPEIISGKY